MQGKDSGAAGAVEVRRGGLNLDTPHPPQAYPGLIVVKVGPGWPQWIIVPEDGQTIHALGGERVVAYTTRDGTAAEGFELRQGDLAIRVRSGLDHHMAEWRIVRASPPGSRPGVTGAARP